MSFTMYVDNNERGPWEPDVFAALVQAVQADTIPLTVRDVSTFRTRPLLVRTRDIALSHTLAIIQKNNLFGTYVALECHDFVDPIDDRLRNLVFDPRCRLVLKCQYQEAPFRQRPYTKIQPWSYFEAFPRDAQEYVAQLRSHPRSDARLFFRGNVTMANRDAILSCLAERELVTPDYSRRIGYRHYLQESARHKLVLGLPGMGNVCHREIEAFGVGTTVLMPRLKNVLHNDLIPDYHYISVAADVSRDEPALVADQIEARYRQVIHDQGYLSFVAANAVEWYEANVRFSNSIRWTRQLLSLSS